MEYLIQMLYKLTNFCIFFRGKFIYLFILGKTQEVTNRYIKTGKKDEILQILIICFVTRII